MLITIKPQLDTYYLSSTLKAHPQMFAGNYREIGVQGFQIYGDCNPCNFEIPHSYFHRNICREFDSTGKVRGFPALDVVI